MEVPKNRLRVKPLTASVFRFRWRLTLWLQNKFAEEVKQASVGGRYEKCSIPFTGQYSARHPDAEYHGGGNGRNQPAAGLTNKAGQVRRLDCEDR